MTWQHVHMPKTGGSSVANALIRAGRTSVQGHTPAHAYPPGSMLFGTLRSPEAWYCSFYAHLRRAIQPHRGRVGSARAWAALETYGGGSIEFRDVLPRLLRPQELATRGRLPFPGDALFAPAGLATWPCGGLYALHVVWWYRGGPGQSDPSWRVQAMVETSRLAEGCAKLGITGVKHLNASGGFRPSWPSRIDVPAEDRRMWEEAQALMV